ncbi:hypothetical protein E5163_01735 [Marinicauda algicola]|uniref:Uncharacterized protein n=1 Tax=Marinicauda algicola TaxID=2029849 RepID=A0A4S2H2W8_9PROT|nr:hypothetical protein [Marinicauda algicola]TGY89886.1 hypothetical protein E5163_01735 [Marinicauda algicola]
MKRLLMAAAAAPLLIACTTASASEIAGHDGETRVLLINGERIELADGESARDALNAALEGAPRPPHAPGAPHAPHIGFDFDFEFDGTGWSEEERAEFEAEMEELAESLAGLGEQLAVLSELDEDRVRVRVAEIERFHEEHGQRMEEHARRMAERAEAMAAHGERMRIVGLSAGLSGMEAGLAGIERALERGWVHDDGERRELTADEIEDLTEARDDLRRDIEEFRAEHADALALLDEEGPGHHRVLFYRTSAEAPLLAGAEARFRGNGEGGQIRIRRRDNEIRVWVDGRELEGAEKEAWLEEHGEPAAPPAPPAAPDLEGN